MVFNSFSFLIFFPTVVTLYFLTPHRWRWALLLAASCIFYMAFIPIYILILFFTIIIDYFAGLWIAGSVGPRRKLALTVSIVANVAVLAVFKYYNFFIGNINAIGEALHWNYSMLALSIALPIGLSFHTFQAMSYTIEVYRGNAEPERHFGIYALYVMFFPQLVAGPIERPQHLLPQFHREHRFDYHEVTSGLKLMAWGFFKKVVIADRLAPIVNDVYDKPGDFGAAMMVVGTVFFAYQIYCDFSGYSDIALGSAQVMGFSLMKNFNRPYAARTFRDFWRRWHISLSSWFRDYVYLPLGGNRTGTIRTAVNLIIVFTVSGLWHGANWTYVVWGALHGVYVAGERLLSKTKLAEALHSTRGVLRSLVELGKWTITISLVMLAWVFFRAATVKDAFIIARQLPEGVGQLIGNLGNAVFLRQALAPALGTALLIPVLSIVILEIIQFHQERGSVRERLAASPMWLRWAAYYALVGWIVFFGRFEAEQFIYFQF